MKNIINTKGNFDAQGSKITQTNKNIKITVGTVVIVVVMITSFLFLINRKDSVSLLGRWETEEGHYVNFISDGTMDTDLHYVWDNPDTYEILEEGYLKWGKYIPTMVQYKYTYWEITMDGKDIMVLTSREDSSNIIRLIRKQ